MVSGIFQSSANNYGINFGPSNPGGTIYSKIYDNANLHIWTDDGLYFDIGGGPPGNITGTPSGVNVALITLTNFGINTNSYVSGNLGVGKTSVTAGYALDVNGNTYVGGNLTVNNGFTVSAGTVSFPAGSISSSAISGGVNVAGINSTGNVAINKTTPASNTQLDINGNLMVSGAMFYATNTPGINFGPSAIGGTIGTKMYDDGSLHIWNDDGMFIDVGGTSPPNAVSYPVGTTNAAFISNTSFLIKVNASVNKSSVTAGYALDVNGNVLATYYNASSDARLKTHIQPLVSTFDTIQKINAVSFDWKGNGKSDCGFIAQNVFEHLPNMRPDNWSIDIEEPVDASGNPIYYSIDYSKMTPHLWGAVNDLVKDNRRLTEENAILKKRIERIEAALGL
jgi:hypothetical protein